MARDAGNVLLVEGRNDAFVFATLCAHHGIQARIEGESNAEALGALGQGVGGGPSTETEEGLSAGIIAIKNEEGLTNLVKAFPTALKQSGLQRLGVVVDCDPEKGMCARWQQWSNLARNAGYDVVPKTPAQQGTILFREGGPALGLWVMPDNQGEGLLEDFVGFLVPPGDAMWEWADKCLDQVPPCPSRFKPSHRAKARIHSWLAWQEEPGTPMGSAITQRYLDAHAAHALRFVAWLRLLFESNCVAARGPLSEAEAG